MPRDLAAFYATEDWTRSPFVETRTRDSRLYACKCSYWVESFDHLLKNDRESAGDPAMPWECGGHPAPELPVTLGELTIADDTDWPALVQRIVDGACPRPLAREEDEGPALWLAWLYAYLAGLPAAAALSRAIAARTFTTDREDHMVGAALAVFARFPNADGVEHLVDHASSHLDAVLVGHAVHGSKSISLWDVLIARMSVRLAVNTMIDARTEYTVQRVMKLPMQGGGEDRIAQTLGTWYMRDSFRLSDFVWMANNIVAIEMAGPGRWSNVLGLLLHAWRNSKELAHLVVTAGNDLVQHRCVSIADMREWIATKGHKTHAWTPLLEAALDRIEPARAEREALYREVVAMPDRDGPRRRYAECLDRQGDETGELIRLSLRDLRYRRTLEQGRRAHDLELALRHRLAAPVGVWISGSTIHRGLVAGVEMNAATFLESGHEVFARTPIQHLDLVGVKPLLAEILNSPLLARVQTLNLKGNDLDDNDVMMLAASPSVRRLVYLCLWSNRIGDAGLEAIAASENLAGLRILEFGGNLVESPVDRYSSDGVSGLIWYEGCGPMQAALKQKYGEKPRMHPGESTVDRYGMCDAGE